MDWFKANVVPGQDILVHTRQPVPYPERTAYFIPALSSRGEKELARTCTKGLMSIQMPDGAFPAPDGVSYIVDAIQIMRGLCTAQGDVDSTEHTLRRASDWMLTLVAMTGDRRTAQFFNPPTQPPRDLDPLPVTVFKDVAADDFDMDVDLFVLASDDDGQQENLLLPNDGNGNHWLMSGLGGTRSNRNGIAALMHVTAGGLHHGDRYHSRLRFGLAKNAQIATITVHWPSGMAQVFSGMKTDRVIGIKEAGQPAPRECRNV